MNFKLWSKTPGRHARGIGCVALAICVVGGALGTTAASADATRVQAPRARTPRVQPAVYNLVKANFGLTPGAGFFLDETHLPAGLNDFKTLGVHWIRSTITWSSFQPYDPAHLPAGEPKYKWKSIDEFVSQVHDPKYADRFSFIVTIDGPPAWAKAAGHIGTIPCAMQPPFDLAAYARATAALAQHLKGTAQVFELENSPNIGTRSATHENTVAVWPVPNPCGYAQLLKLATPAIHAANAAATVLVGGIGGVKDKPNERIAADNFVADLYANGARGYFDGVSYHPYSSPDLPCAASDKVCVFNPEPSRKDPYGMKNGWDRMLNARKMMVAKGDSAKQMWITEYGGPTAGPRGSMNVLTEAQQASLLKAGFERASQYSWVAMMSWFTYDDDPGENPQHAPNGAFMGLLRADHSPKPAYTTYQLMTASAQ